MTLILYDDSYRVVASIELTGGFQHPGKGSILCGPATKDPASSVVHLKGPLMINGATLMIEKGYHVMLEYSGIVKEENKPDHGTQS